ncbi:MAG: ATP-binding protein [Betaproteobacteria bacterium]
MSPLQQFSPIPSVDNFQRLLLLRSVMIGVEASAVLIASGPLGIALQWPWMLGILLLLATVTAHAWLRVRSSAAIRDREYFAQLMIDVAALSALLYLSGGSSNPFVSLYLLPLVIAATTLPATYAWITAAVTASSYALLFFFHVPLAGLQANHADHGFGLHLVGMWLNFLVSAVIICGFVIRMAAAIRRRDALLAKQIEDALRNERIVALGTLAAGAAHALGTPLSTMAVVLGEMADEHGHTSQLASDIATLRNQVARCKQTITHMIAASGQARAEGGSALPVDEFLLTTLERWQLMRPSVCIAQSIDGVTPGPSIVAEQTLEQAITNLLDNAADASAASVELDCRWDCERLYLEIRDRGPGLSAELEARIGHGFFTTKPAGEGNGIGLLLARATVERLGGLIRLRPREGGGAVTQLELPLASLSPFAANQAPGIRV